MQRLPRARRTSQKPNQQSFMRIDRLAKLMFDRRRLDVTLKTTGTLTRLISNGRITERELETMCNALERDNLGNLAGVIKKFDCGSIGLSDLKAAFSL